MVSFREWLSRKELNESVKNIDLKKYIKSADFPQDKFRKDIEKDLTKLLKEYYSTEKDITKYIKPDMFLVTTHQLKQNKGITEGKVYLCNTSPEGIANYKGDIFLIDLISGRKTEFILGGGIYDRLQLLNKSAPVGVYFTVESIEQWKQEASRISIGNIFIDAKDGKLKDTDFGKYIIDVFNNLKDKDYDSITKMLNEKIKSVIEEVKYK